MQTVRIFNKCEGQQAEINGKTVTLNGKSATELGVLDWLELQNIWKKQIDGDFFYPENKQEEQKAIAEFRRDLWVEFERMGIPAVKVAIGSGKFSKGVLKELATEWSLEKSESRDLEAISIAREASNSSATSAAAAKEQARWAKYAAIIAAIAAIVAVIFAK